MRRIIAMAAVAAALLAAAGCAQGRNEVAVTVTDNGFEPSGVSVKKGVPATLVITRKTDATCATEAIFEESGQRYELPLNEPVRIPLETSAPATFHYACGMDMYKGEVTVQ